MHQQRSEAEIQWQGPVIDETGIRDYFFPPHSRLRSPGLALDGTDGTRKETTWVDWDLPWGLKVPR